MNTSRPKTKLNAKMGLIVTSILSLVNAGVGTVIAVKENLPSVTLVFTTGKPALEDFLTGNGTALSPPLYLCIIALLLILLALQSQRPGMVGVVGLTILGVIFLLGGIRRNQHLSGPQSGDLSPVSGSGDASSDRPGPADDCFRRCGDRTEKTGTSSRSQWTRQAISLMRTALNLFVLHHLFCSGRNARSGQALCESLAPGFSTFPLIPPYSRCLSSAPVKCRSSSWKAKTRWEVITLSGGRYGKILTKEMTHFSHR